MNSSQANNRILVTLVAALLVPWIERVSGVKLTTDEVAGLVGLATAAAHAAAALFLRYFPPPSVPMQPPQAAGDSK